MAFEVKYVPECVSDKKSTLAGHVLLRIPTIMERLNYMDVAGVEIDEKGTVNLAQGQIKGISKLMELSQAHYVKVDIKRKDGSYEFTSFDELASDGEGCKVLTDVALKILHGFNISKN